tara:strand:+ start:3094 stop:3678 length:585 start_codon:yes stop_codon:yes gene_type:complete
LKGVDQPWEHEGNVLRIGPSDFREEYRERNWNIYNMCVLEKRTLSFAAEKHGLSRERVRQIVAKAHRIMRVRRWVRGGNKKKAEMTMGDMPLSTRTTTILTSALGEEWTDAPILLFAGAFKPDELLRWPGAGRKSFLEIHNRLKEVDEDVANIWTSGHGEDYNPAKHGRRRIVVRNISQQDRLSRIYKKGRNRG